MTGGVALATPWIGVLAMGLHNPAVHGLFVLPFLIRITLAKQWRKTIYFASVYTLGCAVWLAWMVYVSNGIISGGGEPTLSSSFVLPGLVQVLFQIMNLSLMLSWQSYALVFLVLVAGTTRKTRTPFEQDLIWSCLSHLLVLHVFQDVTDEWMGLSVHLFDPRQPGYPLAGGLARAENPDRCG